MEDTKGLSEFVNRRSIDKTMEKIKRTKEKTTIYKTLQKTRMPIVYSYKPPIYYISDSAIPRHVFFCT
jgi:hypothetical protein